jgi:hypothetical protein
LIQALESSATSLSLCGFTPSSPDSSPLCSTKLRTGSHFRKFQSSWAASRHSYGAAESNAVNTRTRFPYQITLKPRREATRTTRTTCVRVFSKEISRYHCQKEGSGSRTGKLHPRSVGVEQSTGAWKQEGRHFPLGGQVSQTL